jgi:hypothetical protein
MLTAALTSSRNSGGLSSRPRSATARPARACCTSPQHSSHPRRCDSNRRRERSGISP